MLQQQIWFLITEWLNTLNLNWRKSWAVSRLNIRWNHRERELVFSAKICGFLTQKGSKTSQLKDTLKSLCPDKLFAVICQRNTQWSSAYSRMCSPNMSTNSSGTDSEEAFFLKCPVPPFSTVYGHLFFLLPNKCHRLFIFMSAAQVFSMKDIPLHRLHSKKKKEKWRSCTLQAAQGARRTRCWLLSNPECLTVEELLTENYNFLSLICFLCLDAGA